MSSPKPRNPPQPSSLCERSKPLLLNLRLCALFVSVTLLYPFFLVYYMRSYLATAPTVAVSKPPSLTVATLIYDQSDDHKNIAHNCRIIAATRHRFIIFTDDVSQSYCSLCDCRRFVKQNCPCPAQGPHACTLKNPCEKLAFVVSAVRQFREVLILDDDLLIMKHTFLDHLAARAQAHDFLATYGHDTITSVRYLRNFNSGLMFMRWLPTINYDEMTEALYRNQGARDQSTISWFVQKRYSNWDVLSWKWHCRMLLKKQDIPPSECYTLHDRNEVSQVLKVLNATRLSIP